MKNFLKKVAKIAKTKKQFKELPKFIEEFYSQNDVRDFVNYSEDDMVNYAKQSFSVFQSKKSNEHKIRISDIEGSINHSVIDIVNIDRPFLVDSIVNLLENLKFDIKNIIHPIFEVSRDGNGNLTKFDKATSSSSSKILESVIQVQFKDQLNREEKAVLLKEVQKILSNIEIVVEDWHKIIDQVHDSQNQIFIENPTQDIHEVKAFISWLVEKGFVFLGFIEFDYKKDKSNKYHLVESKKNPPLGVFRSKDEDFRPRFATNSTHEEIKYSIDNPYVIEILKSSYKSKIHRFINAERIRIQKFSHSKVVGEFRVIGLFTSSAYYQSPTLIPLIKHKISKVIEMSGYSERSHNYKDLISVLKHYPRDELFQIETEDLLRIATGIVMICGRNQVKVFARKDKFKRFINCFVLMPKDRSNSELRQKITKHLESFYNGKVTDFYVEITESSLVRIQFVIKIEQDVKDLREEQLEKEITELSKPWSASFKEQVYKNYSADIRKEIYSKYINAFTVSYKNRFFGDEINQDINNIEKAIADNQVKFSYTYNEDVSELKIYSPKEEIYLSMVMPILESFGLNVIHEHTYAVTLSDREEDVKINYFRIENSQNIVFDADLKQKFELALSKTYEKNLGLGLLNKILLAANIDWRTIFLFKSYAKYIQQTGFISEQDFISSVMIENINITRQLIELFELKFDPNIKLSLSSRVKKCDELVVGIRSALTDVSNAAHDDVLRRFFHVINATVRTNYYQLDSDGNHKNYLSFKFDCAKIPELPLPKPHAEIFVHSNRVEGVHLRGGKVARGGLRWSDRKLDFRTEVLGLVKAQMTKNAVIVPVGSKGGFVVKEDTSGLSREQHLNLGIECYKEFLRGILDLTDNIVNSEVITPENLICHDEQDPYLVVAADKGTATFSDIANSISEEYNFWLGDAFASGGSVGYDHKKMGITAKGAWVCVTRHFKEMGIDCQKDEFTCVGIGDMAGDVFGNGLLCSSATKLVAAFNHMHIFIDPNPDAKKSYQERKRMFELPRSSWLDYNKKLISKGGGIFERSAKSISLTKEIKQLINVEVDELTPNELIKALLKAEVDLLWNGGIGTYVKSSLESHLDVGDRANDNLRVNGSELGCKIVGEGGNLGLTQLGRIEYAMNGGRINTDSMDNSAGVDCSDHEVNIKIALAKAVESKKLTPDKRNKLLEEMTEEVSDLVLRDNFMQSQAISNSQNLDYSHLSNFAGFINNLENSGQLNREIEYLPTSKEIKRRQAEKIGLTRPELCVLLSYAKMEIYNELLKSDILNDEHLEEKLVNYFPTQLRKKFNNVILNHSLRKEIIATQITNDIVNFTGIYFVNNVAKTTGYSISEVVKATLVVVEAFGLNELWNQLSYLDSSIASNIQSEMFIATSKLIERSVVWLVKNVKIEDISTSAKNYQKIYTDLYPILATVMAKDSKESYQEKLYYYQENNVKDKQLVAKIASMDPIASIFDISNIASLNNLNIKIAAKIYYEVGTRFSLKWLRKQLANIAINSNWDKLSVKNINEELYHFQMKIARNIIASQCSGKKSCDIDAVSKWIEASSDLMAQFDNLIAEIKGYQINDFSIFIVTLEKLRFVTLDI